MQLERFYTLPPRTALFGCNKFCPKFQIPTSTSNQHEPGHSGSKSRSEQSTEEIHSQEAKPADPVEPVNPVPIQSVRLSLKRSVKRELTAPKRSNLVQTRSQAKRQRDEEV